MTARIAASDAVRKDGVMQQVPMIASETIYAGSPVMIVAASGHAFSNDGTTNTLGAGDIFAGIAVETVTSRSTAGVEYVRAYRKGSFQMTFSDTLTQANLGDKVYVNNTSDDSVVTITVDAGVDVQIGNIVEFVSVNVAIVAIDGFAGSAVAA